MDNNMFIINVQNIWDKNFQLPKSAASQQKGWTKKVEELPWEFSDFELTANQITRKICRLQIFSCLLVNYIANILYVDDNKVYIEHLERNLQTEQGKFIELPPNEAWQLVKVW